LYCFALAAVAAVGTSFAQVSITGGVDFTFGKTTADATNGTAGRGLSGTDAYIDVGVTEDLGGGLKAVINMEFNADGAWAAGAYAGDKNITLAGASGSLTLANTRSGGILNAVMLAPIVSSTDHWSAANAGVMARGNVDALVVMLPAMSGVTLGYKYVEGSDVAAAAAVSTANTTTGAITSAPGAYVAGVGSPASVTHVLYAKYAQGPLTVVGEYNIRASEYLTGDARGQRVDLTAAYDAGVAKVAVGFETGGLNTANSSSTGTAASATLLSISAPVGNNSVGMNWGKRDAASFTEFGGQYNFSKLTYVTASVGTIVSQAGVSSDTFGVRLGKNF
jgi:hypothetical protein